jgi:diaminohydroxyphosphoribosylaminopyrimidine deaminase/5-amino-6-(5-phosphoribosylamino)uracil reductase
VSDDLPDRVTDPSFDVAVGFMLQAVDIGRLGDPSPNPHVGAIVVADNEMVGVGHHARAGETHAEVAALVAAGARAEGADLYVTLEPCNHFGRTAPCTRAIIDAGVRRVFVGTADPNPHVEGGGVDALRRAGIEVIENIARDSCEALLAPWTKFVTTGVPFVALKLALSLDGRIATRTGASRWITGPEARARVHVLRAESDAVVVGIGTALADDPALTVRDVAGRNPARVVVDSQLKLTVDSTLAATANEVQTYVLTTEEASEERSLVLRECGIAIIRCPPSPEGRVDLEYGLRALGERGIVRVLVEGGAELAGSLLAARLADRLHAFVAPLLLGPRGRPGAVDWCGPAEIIEAPRILDPQWEVCGVDAHVFGRVGYPDDQ